MSLPGPHDEWLARRHECAIAPPIAGMEEVAALQFRVRLREVATEVGAAALPAAGGGGGDGGRGPGHVAQFPAGSGNVRTANGGRRVKVGPWTRPCVPITVKGDGATAMDGDCPDVAQGVGEARRVADDGDVSAHHPL